jgi:hypothetical protein
MRRFSRVCFLVAFAHPLILLAADEPKAAAKFVEQAGIELAKTEKLLKLNKDFTIELLAKWQPGRVYLAGDEAWPGMSDYIKVAETSGWVLRTDAAGNKETLDFNVATKEKAWISLKGDIPLKRPEWNHIAIGRKKDTLVLFFNGVTVAQSPLGGLTLIGSPTPLYIGVRDHAFAGRRMNGYIAKFGVSQTFRFPQGPKPGLVFKNDKLSLLLLSLDGQQGGVVNDLTGNGHLGVLRDAEIVNFE